MPAQHGVTPPSSGDREAARPLLPFGDRRHAARPGRETSLGAPETKEAPAALAAAVAEQEPRLLSWSMARLYAVVGLGYLVSTMKGYDSSLMSSLNAMQAFQQSFQLNGTGSSSGLIFIVFNLGMVVSMPFCSLLADGYGRRACIFIGCLVVLAGTLIQYSAMTLDQFMAGRFILGWGAGIASAAGPMYVVELAHPAYRGTMAGMYNNCWFLGSIIAGWTTYGTNLTLSSSYAWRIPVLLQGAIPLFVGAVIFFCPESPRWLIHNKRSDEALAFFTKYHGNGDHRSPLVTLQYREIVEDYGANNGQNRWWDLGDLVSTRQARYRLLLVALMAFFGQWSGNGVITYFLPEMIRQVGITDTNHQLLTNAILPVVSMAAAIYGATLLDRLGRRKMLLFGLGGCLVSYALLTSFTALASGETRLAVGTIVAIFMFNMCFAWSFTPLQTLYAVECLENHTRAKGSALNFLFLNIALVCNTYGISVLIDAIGWRLYIAYTVWIGVEIVIVYFLFVETAGYTLEELSDIFHARNPRKASIGGVVGAATGARKERKVSYGSFD